jgi:hypothetical protein
MPRQNAKLKRATGIKKGNGDVMTHVPEAASRPGEWRTMLRPAPTDATANKNRHEPLAVDDEIVKRVADGGKASEIEDELHVRRGYVRDVLIRKFGSIEGMKLALRAQCLENAIALNEYAMTKIQQIPPGQALVGAKIMIDGAIALEKSSTERPSTVDFAALAALGQTLERVEKLVTGSDRTISPTALPA